MNSTPPDSAEQPVWDWLDAHAIPFREPVANWVERFGDRDEWPAVRGRRRRMSRCAQQSDLFPDQLESLGIDLDRVAGPLGPASTLIARALTVPSSAAAAERMTAAITAALGPPTAPSWPHHRVWMRGLARVTMRAGTPDTRYADEGVVAYAQRRASAIEVEIQTGVAASLSPGEAEMMERAEPIIVPAPSLGEVDVWPEGLSPGIRRRISGVAPSLRFDPPSSTLIVTRAADALVIPASEVATVRVLDTLPARGGGSAMLGFDLAMPYPPEARVEPWRPHTGWLVGGRETEVHSLAPLAQKLAGLLGAPVVTDETHDA